MRSMDDNDILMLFLKVRKLLSQHVSAQSAIITSKMLSRSIYCNTLDPQFQ